MSKNEVKIKKLVLRISLITFTFLLSLFILFSSFCSLSIYKFANAIIQNDENLYGKTYVNAGFCINWFTPFEELAKAFRNKKYIVLLQNNYELRASGGFMGSYAVLNFGSTGLETWKVENIYVPDGQLKGHVTPIKPIQQAFRTGDWRLRDSNWEVDFPKAAKDIEWFFNKGGEENIDGIIAINFSLFENLVKILGNINVTDYDIKVYPNSLYILTQTYSEKDSFPGSTQKQSFLNSLGKSMLNKVKEASVITKIKITLMLINELKNGQILISIKDNNLAQKLNRLNLDGSLGNYNFDFLYPVESNLGANKANGYIERSIIQNVNIKNNKITSQVTITWKNRSVYESPKPPSFWGGNYINYERIVLPKNAINITVTVNNKNYLFKNIKDISNLPRIENDFTYSLEQYGNFQIIGFWVLVPAKYSLSSILSYNLPLKQEQKKYEVNIKSQPGIKNLEYNLILNGKILVKEILNGNKIYKRNIEKI
ncbi:hypothetical protein A2V55_02480 [Candidatus Woesebacteria bacterium RBG_19FT_COMBO_37_29]|nr:MAG: hypothetical protein A2V55_02480 [Candidatus Woesebacteria bacterium RBG_19FT_COMBO_37_29]